MKRLIKEEFNKDLKALLSSGKATIEDWYRACALHHNYAFLKEEFLGPSEVAHRTHKAEFEVDVAMVVNDDEQEAEEDQEDELAKLSADERSAIESVLVFQNCYF